MTEEKVKKAPSRTRASRKKKLVVEAESPTETTSSMPELVIVQEAAAVNEVDESIDTDNSMLVEEYKFIDVHISREADAAYLFSTTLKIVFSIALLIFPGLVLLALSFWEFGAPLEALAGIVLIFLGLKVFIRNFRRLLST
jgi:hypothetical protein